MKLMIFLTTMLLTITLFAGESMKLPAPQQSGGTPLYEALKKRSTERNFSNKKLTRQQISQILWAAAGVSRPEIGKRTAPSAWGNHEIILYVLLEEGTFRYNPVDHTLETLNKKDMRYLGGRQGFVKTAPMTVVMVADLDRIKQVTDEATKLAIGRIDVGYVSQNIYLAAISGGLITGARANIDGKKFEATLKLPKNERVIIANSIGYRGK